jgi:predicted PurR-regulated permease PerM
MPHTGSDTIVIAAIIAVAAIVSIWRIVALIILGSSLAVVLIPLHRRLVRHTREVVSAAMITIAVFLLLAGCVYATVAILAANAGVMTTLFSAIAGWLANPTTDPAVYGVPLPKETLSAILVQGNALFSNSLSTIQKNLTDIIVSLAVFFFSFFLLLLKGETLKDWFMSRMPVPVQEQMPRIEKVTVDTLYAIYIVQVAIAVLTFFISIPVFYFLGYGNVLFYSFLAAFCELVPVLGSSVAFIIVGAYALALGDIRGVLILFVFGYLIVSAVPEIYIRPALIGRRVKIHWLIMFVGVIGGILTMGIAGFVLGPLIIVLLITWYRIWKEKRRKNREHPKETGAGSSTGTGDEKPL